MKAFLIGLYVFALVLDLVGVACGAYLAGGETYPVLGVTLIVLDSVLLVFTTLAFIDLMRGLR